MKKVEQVLNQASAPKEEKNHVEDSSLGFLNIREISSYLGVKVSTAYTLVEKREIPHFRIGRLIRFKRSDIDAWMDKQKQGVVDIEVEAKKVFRFFEKKSNLDIEKILKGGIDEVKGKRYSGRNGKPDQIKGLRKEASDGTL